MPYKSLNQIGDLALINSSNDLGGTTSAPGEITPDPETLRYSMTTVGGVLYVTYSQTLGDLSINPPKISKDWWNDFDILNMKAPGLNHGHVHEGFFKEYQKTEQTILDKIQVENPVEVCCVGYSKGGIQATYLAYRLLILLPKICVSLKSFASPKGFDWDGAQEVMRIFKENCDRFAGDRIVRAGDMVPRLPPFLMDYAHVLKQRTLGMWFWPWPNPAHHLIRQYRKFLK